MEPARYDPFFVRGTDYAVRFAFKTPPVGSTQSTLLKGTGEPPASLGANGDYYIDLQAQVGYGPKTAGVWGASAVLPTVDYSGYTFASQLRVFEDDSLACELDVDDTDSDIGVVVFSIPNAESSGLGREYAWDLDITSPDGLIATPLAGTATVKLDVTRTEGS